DELIFFIGLVNKDESVYKCQVITNFLIQIMMIRSLIIIKIQLVNITLGAFSSVSTQKGFLEWVSAALPLGHLVWYKLEGMFGRQIYLRTHHVYMLMSTHDGSIYHERMLYTIDLVKESLIKTVIEAYFFCFLSFLFSSLTEGGLQSLPQPLK